MIKNIVKEYINQNKKVVIGLGICILIGIIAGVFIYAFTNKEVKDTLIGQVNYSIKNANNGEFIKTDIIYNGIKNNMCLVLIMFLFSMMLYGAAIIYLMYIIKGIAIGMYICTLLGAFGVWWGIIAVMCLVVFVNIVYIPVMIYIGSTLINYNISIMEYRENVNKIMPASSVILKVFLGIIVVFSSVIIEQLLSNIVIKISQHI